MKSLIIISFLLLLGSNGFGQERYTIAVYSNDKSENEMYLNGDLKKKFYTQFNDALETVDKLKSKDYYYISNKIEGIFKHYNWSQELIKEKVDWSSDLISKYGLPSSDSILLKTTHPISWILIDTSAAIEHRITFEFIFFNDAEQNHNSIGIEYKKRDNQITGERNEGYNFNGIWFNKAIRESEIMNFLNNMKEEMFAYSLDSALKSNPNDITKIKLKETEYKVFNKKHLKTFPNLIDLRFYGSTLNEIPDFVKKMTYLKKLNASQNNLTEIPIWLPKLKHLEELNLSYNQINSVPKNFKELKSLKKLELQWNSLGFMDVVNVKNWFDGIELKIGQQE